MGCDLFSFIYSVFNVIIYIYGLYNNAVTINPLKPSGYYMYHNV